MFNQLRILFGLRHPLGLHDLDLPDEPLDPAPRPDPVLRPGVEASAQGVDGPTAQAGEASAVGHQNHEIRSLLEEADDILAVELDAITTQLAEIVNHTTAIVRATGLVIDRINAIDPTPVGLSRVTDISTRRK